MDWGQTKYFSSNIFWMTFHIFDKSIFRMRKAKIEATNMAPTFAEDNVKFLAHNVTWE